MPPSAAKLFGPLLYLALAEPIGLLCRTTGGVDRALQRLYTARRELADPALAELQFRKTQGEGDLWIVRRQVVLGQAGLPREGVGK